MYPVNMDGYSLDIDRRLTFWFYMFTVGKRELYSYPLPANFIEKYNHDGCSGRPGNVRPTQSFGVSLLRV